MSANDRHRLHQPIRPERVMALGFLALILLGTGLLCLPVMVVPEHAPLTLFEGLFTATSAVCVTGLVTVDTGTTFSALGQGVLLALIQVGGLGFMVFATLVMSLLGRRVSLRGRVLLQDSTGSSGMRGVRRLTVLYGAMAAGIELFGALLLSFRFVPMYGWGKGLWYSVFHAVSAFCNAGFDLFGHFSSLTGFRSDAWVLLVISLMIQLGGIGFCVILEVAQERTWRTFSLHTKLVLAANAALLLGGTLVYALLEWDNTATLAADGAGAGTRLLGAFFQSVTMRTAGFNSVDLGGLTSAGKLFSVILMFIGASPASTGGGIKTTTVTVLFLTAMGTVRGHEDLSVFHRRLPRSLPRRAFTITGIALTMLLLCTMVLACAERDGVPLIDLMFESASAVATVGVSAVGTPSLHMAGRVFLIPCMFLGRVGPMTLAVALASRGKRAAGKLRWPEEDITIG